MKRPLPNSTLALLLALGLSWLGACSGGGGGGGGSNSTVALGKATVLPTACAGGPGPTPGSACISLLVESKLNSAARVDLRVTDPPTGVPLLGTVVLGFGGIGVDFTGNNPGGTELIDALLAAGFRVVDRSWTTGWFGAGPGMRTQSIRFPVLMEWVLDNLHTTGTLCVVGNSGGASEIAYALTSWDGDSLFDVAVLMSGPPHARLDYLCESPPSTTWIAQCAALPTPGAFTCGVPTCLPELTNPVCPLLPPNPQPGELQAQSVLFPLAVLDYPNTTLHLLLGADDCSIVAPLGLLYAAAVTSPITVQVVPNTPHDLQATPEGRAAIVQSLLSSIPAPDSGPGSQGPRLRVRMTWIELE